MKLSEFKTIPDKNENNFLIVNPRVPYESNMQLFFF